MYADPSFATMTSTATAVLWFALVTVSVSGSQPATYHSVSIGSTGRVHIVSQSGREMVPPRVNHQVAFGSPAISPDGRTIGWLVLYPYPEPAGYKYVRDPIPGLLVLYRNGRIIRRLRMEPTVYKWRFQSDSKQVAYCTGPLHGGGTECSVRSVDSGEITAYWR